MRLGSAILTLGLLAAAAPVAPAHAILIDLAPASQSVGLGTPVSVDLNISALGLGTAPSLGTFSVDIDFDPAVLSFTGATFSTGLDILGLGSIQAVTPGAGSVNMFEVSLDSAADLDALQADAFTLATLAFDTIALGTSALILNNVILGDALGDGIVPSQILGASVTVSAPISVPEPGSLAVFGAGLVLLLMFGRRCGHCPA